MADNALYISSLEQVKPTIFELIAQESLMKTLQPSFNLLCQVLRNNSHFSLDWFFKFQEEWYLLLNFLLQSHYIRHYNASFSEYFYGLRRVPIESSSLTMSAYSKSMSLFCLAGLPYLSSKMKHLIEKYQLDVISRGASSEMKHVKPLMFVYRGMNALHEIAKLYSLVAYISGFSQSHSPLFKISNVKLVYQNVVEPSWTELLTDYYKNRRVFSNLIFPATSKFISQLFELSAFTIQFLNWWHSDEVKTTLNSLPIPPPLQIDSNNKMLCPICGKKRKVEVVLPTSGYVYCYRCIREELQITGKCPVTNLPATPENLIRIYSEK